MYLTSSISRRLLFYLQSRRRIRLVSVVIRIPWEFTALLIVPQSHHTSILKRCRIKFHGITTIIKNQLSHSVVVFGSFPLKKCTSTEIAEKKVNIQTMGLEKNVGRKDKHSNKIDSSKILLTEHNGFLVQLAVALVQQLLRELGQVVPGKIDHFHSLTKYTRKFLMRIIMFHNGTLCIDKLTFGVVVFQSTPFKRFHGISVVRASFHGITAKACEFVKDSTSDSTCRRAVETL